MATFPTIQPSSLIGQTQAPQVGRGISVVDAAGVAIGAAAGADARETAQRERAEKEFAARQYQDEAHLAITNSVGAEHMQSLTDAQDAASTGQMTGFVDRWGKGFDQRVKDGEQSIPDIGKAAYREQMASLKNQLQPRFAQQEIGARNAGLVQSAGDASDTSANIVYADRSQGMDQLARTRASIAGLLLPDEEKARLNERATQSIGYAYGANFAGGDPRGFLARYTGAAGAKNIAGDPMLATLKPENMERLTQHAMTLVAQQDAAGARGADESEKIASDETTKLRDFVDKGDAPNLDYVARIKATTAGTSYAAVADALLRQASANAGFGAQTLPRQQQILAGMEASAQQNGTSPEEAAILASRRTIAAKQAADYKEDPWSASTRYAKLPAQPDADIQAPEDGLKVIAQRRNAISAVETAAGGPVSPLKPAEASAWADRLKTLPVSQRSEILASAGEGLRPGQVNALADQIGAKDKATALMLKVNDRTTAGRAVATLIGLGAQGIADKRVKVDDAAASGWRNEIAGYVRGAIGDEQAENDAIDAAYFVRAAGELPDSAAPGFASPGRNNRAAVELVLGTPIERGGVKSFLPRGMSESTFNDRLRAMTPETLKAQAPDGQAYVNGNPMPLNILHGRLVDYGMRYFAPGVYAPVRGNAIVTTDRQGTKPLLLRVQ